MVRELSQIFIRRNKYGNIAMILENITDDILLAAEK